MSSVSLLSIFIITAAFFESLRRRLCVPLIAPLSRIGVFLTFGLTEASFNREAEIGLGLTAGLVVNAALLLIHRINALRREAELTLETAVVHASVQRTRTVLMTDTSTMLALVPLVHLSESLEATV